MAHNEGLESFQNRDISTCSVILRENLKNFGSFSFEFPQFRFEIISVFAGNTALFPRFLVFSDDETREIDERERGERDGAGALVGEELDELSVALLGLLLGGGELLGENGEILVGLGEVAARRPVSLFKVREVLTKAKGGLVAPSLALLEGLDPLLLVHESPLQTNDPSLMLLELHLHGGAVLLVGLGALALLKHVLVNALLEALGDGNLGLQEAPKLLGAHAVAVLAEHHQLLSATRGFGRQRERAVLALLVAKGGGQRGGGERDLAAKRGDLGLKETLVRVLRRAAQLVA